MPGIKLIGSIIAIVIIVIGGWYLYTQYQYDSMWRNDSDFGVLQSDIILRFSDGTEKSYRDVLKDDALSFLPFSVRWMSPAGPVVNSVSYKVTGTATATGYTGVEIDRNNCEVVFRMFDSSGNVAVASPIGPYAQTGTVSGSLNTPIIIYQSSVSSSQIQGSLTPGFYYKLKAWQDDYIKMKYRGTGSETGPWLVAQTPELCSLTVFISSDNTISLVVSSSNIYS